ncbi:MAG TPA: DRTGG domain-containing protein [Thermodesulfobacteriota bacterium]|jgi:predicted transcriptional regulator|nr:DRTGG domain-containing protein [Thermodesulfobacteriota bacterium]
MTLNDIRKVLDAEVIAGNESLDKEIGYAFAADLLSDVLAIARRGADGALLITGNITLQVIYTADVVDLGAILFVRGKRPTESMIQLANQMQIPLLMTSYIMFETCGRLYQLGLKGCVEKAGDGSD